MGSERFNGFKIGELGNHLLKSGKLEVKWVGMVLRENSDSATAVEWAGSFLNIESAAKRFNECWFTGTIWSNKRDSSIEVHIHINLSQDRVTVAITNVGLIQAHNTRPDIIRVREVEAALGVLENIIGDVHSLDSLDTRLHHCGALSVSFELVDELLNVLYFVELVLTLLHLVAVSVGLRLLKLVEVSGVVS